MNRRAVLQAMGAGSVLALAPKAHARSFERLLILVELKGGNDGLNTVVPYANPTYATLRPRIGIARDQVLQLDEHVGLHPSLAPLLPIWNARELAVIQGVGYPSPNLSHFRSIEIWDTASRSDELLADGWLARAFAGVPSTSLAADGVVVGSTGLGPLAGDQRTITMADHARFVRQAKLATPAVAAGEGALSHLLTVEREVARAAASLGVPRVFKTMFPQGPFGSAIRTAAEVAASKPSVAVVRVTLPGFDTHRGQPAIHARVLGQLAAGLVALREALVEIDRWSSTMVLTYAEFGRRAHENESSGTDHGTAAAHFAMGGRVRGGLHGAAPDLDRLDGSGNIAHRVDFRSVFATVLSSLWSIDPRPVLRGAYDTLSLLDA